MAWTLRVEDNADGTGATVFVDGPSLTQEFYITTQVQNAGTAGLTTVQFTHSVIADGPFTIGSVGYYQYRVYNQDTDALLVGPVFQTTTLEGDSIHERCLTMLRDRISDLDLAGLAGVDIAAGGGDVAYTGEYPALILAIINGQEEDLGGGTIHDLVGIPVTGILADRVPMTGNTRRAAMLYWRQAIADAVNYQHWDLRVPEVYQVVMKPAQVLPQLGREFPEYRESWLSFQCQARINRRG